MERPKEKKIQPALLRHRVGKMNKKLSRVMISSRNAKTNCTPPLLSGVEQCQGVDRAPLTMITDNFPTIENVLPKTCYFILFPLKIISMPKMLSPRSCFKLRIVKCICTHSTYLSFCSFYTSSPAITHTHKQPHTVLNSLHRQQFYNHETGIFVGPTGCRPYYGSVRVV